MTSGGDERSSSVDTQFEGFNRDWRAGVVEERKLIEQLTVKTCMLS